MTYTKERGSFCAQRFGSAMRPRIALMRVNSQHTILLSRSSVVIL